MWKDNSETTVVIKSYSILGKTLSSSASLQTNMELWKNRFTCFVCFLYMTTDTSKPVLKARARLPFFDTKLGTIQFCRCDGECPA